MENIKIENNEVLTEEESKIAEEIAFHHYEKLSRIAGNIKPILTLNIKTSHNSIEKETKRKRFSITAKLSGIINLKSEGSDWDLKATLHKTLLKLHHEFEHNIRR